MKPHIIIAVCQRCGSYDSLLKIIKAVVTFERLAGFEAAANIHAATVSQPRFRNLDELGLQDL
jgi:hypothetical protein